MSLRAALLRRLELLDPELSQALHDAPKGAHASDHPWTISPLLGSLDSDGDFLTAVPGRLYRARLSALVPEVLAALATAFDPATSLGREPLVLEHVPFTVVAEACRWEALATYASLLTSAHPRRRIDLGFRSATAFRSRHITGAVPPPRLCLEGYLRKWNAFADIAMPEETLLEYAEAQIRVVGADLRPATLRMGKYYETGVIGEVKWESDGHSPALLRLVNALVDYAFYCGTGIKTAQGMGQTVRVKPIGQPLRIPTASP